MKKSRMMSLVLVGMFAVSSVFAGNVTVQAETGGQSKMLSNRVHSLQNINQSKVLPETKEQFQLIRVIQMRNYVNSQQTIAIKSIKRNHLL